MKSVPSSFWEWVALLDSGERAGLMVLCIVALVFIVSFVLAVFYGMHKNRLADALKRELLDRGMSADEIVAIVRARPIRRARNSNPSSSTMRSDLS